MPAANCRRDTDSIQAEFLTPVDANAAIASFPPSRFDGFASADAAGPLDEAVHAIFAAGGAGEAGEPVTAEPSATAFDSDPFHFDWPFWKPDRPDPA